MTRLNRGPHQLLAVAFLVVTGLLTPNAMARFVDCTDGFWEVACSTERDAIDDTIDGAELSVRIDNDAVCTAVSEDFVVCHT